MDLLSPCPFWPLADGLPASFPALAADERCDVAVLGGGVTGALVAWHLAAAGLSTVVLDRRDVAHGSTAGSTSLLQYEIDVPLAELQRRRGAPVAIACYRRSLQAVEAIGRLVKRLRLDCGYQARSSLYLAKTPAAVPRLRREFEARRAAGFAVEWWPRSRLQAESSLPHAAGIRSRHAGQIDAYALTYGLLQTAAALGTRVYDRTPVRSLRWHPRHLELRCGGGATVRARHAVFATGYEADAVLPLPLTRLQSTFAIVSEPVRAFTGWPADRCLIWECATPYHYLRTTPDGRIMMGGADEPFRDPRERDRLVARKAADLKRQFARYFPRIPFEPACAWAGTFATTSDGLPFIGAHPHFDRCSFALGYGGNGITFSLIAAENLRDRLLGRRRADEDRLFGFSRLSPAPTAPRRARRSLRLSA